MLYAREHVGLIQRDTEAAVARAEAELRDVARPRLEAGERRLKVCPTRARRRRLTEGGPAAC